LCWQTVEQQFNPALAIASAVRLTLKTLIMKFISHWQERDESVDEAG